MAENLEKLFDNLALSISTDSETKSRAELGKHSFDEFCSLVVKRLQDTGRTHQSKRRDIEQFTRLIHISGHELVFPRDKNESENAEGSVRGELLVQIIEAVFSFGTVGQLPESEIGYTKDDFTHVADNSETAMQCFAVILSYIEMETLSSRCKSRLLPALSFYGMVLSLEHHRPAMWTSDGSVAMAKQVLDKTFLQYQCETMSEFLTSAATKKIVKEIMLHVVRNMTKISWKQNPSTKQVYDICLFSMHSPTVSDYLEYLLPVSLLFLDDHELENKILGIKCMDHIIDNTSKAELSWLGRAEVIYDSLQKLMYTHDAELISILHPCLRRILLVLAPDPKRADRPRKHCRSDEIFNRFLHDMDLETKIVLRRAYSKQLPHYVHHMGITTLKHMKTFLHTVFGYLDTFDGPTEESRLYILDAIKEFIMQCWPRVSFHCEALVKALVKFVYDIATDKTRTPVAVKDRLLAKAEHNLMSVKRTCPEKTVKLLQALCEVELGTQCLDILQRVIAQE